MIPILVSIVVFVLLPASVSAQGAPDPPPADADSVMEVVVVTASRTEQRLSEVPAAMTVIDADLITDLPANNYGEWLRMVPGVNVGEFSAGDMGISARRATGVIPKGQLTLIDGRTVYNDFNGQTFWNGRALDAYDIKQIEVLRGPNSAVWGANAIDGVINIITKSPREMQGTMIRFGAGELGSRYATATHAGVRGKIGYKITGSWLEQGPYDRPTGTIPGTEGPRNPGGTPYPQYENVGTEQPKVNARIDYEQDNGGTWSVSGGYAGLPTGLLLTGTGPASYGVGSYSAFAKADWTRDNMRVSAYANFTEGEGSFVLAPTPFRGSDQTYHLDLTDTRVAGGRHIVTYGASARQMRFDQSITSDAPDRTDLGAYLQDDIALSEKFRWLVGARVDNVERMGTTVSPRTSLMYSPVPGNTFRVSYNRAFRAPTIVETHLDVQGAQTIITIPTPGGPLDLVFPHVFVGNPDLNEEKLDSFEVGWVGEFRNRVQASVAVYRNELRDAIQNVQSEIYSSTNPPPDWPLPPELLDVPPPDGFAGIPQTFSAINLAEINQYGVEIGASARVADPWTVFANYSWQDDPKTKGIDAVPHPSGELVVPINLPPTHRFNVGVLWDIRSWYANANVNYQDEAFWTDVLGSDFWGPTEAFAFVNIGGGARFADGSMMVAVKAQNIFDKRAQQHVWSDIISRRVTGEVEYRF